MHILIYLGVFFLGSFINIIIGYLLGFRAGAVLLYIVDYFIAKKICQLYDNSKAKKNGLDVINNEVIVTDVNESLTSNVEGFHSKTIEPTETEKDTLVDTLENDVTMEYNSSYNTNSLINNSLSITEESNTEIEKLIKRIFIFIEDGENKRAIEYCERVIDNNPENAYAYLARLLIDLKCSEIDDLKNVYVSIEDNGNFKKVLRYGGKDLVEQLNFYNSCVKENIENRNNKNTIKKKKVKKNIKIFSLCIAIILVFCASVFATYNYGIPLYKYYKAVGLAESGNYEEAKDIFFELDDYKDSKNQIKECRYNLAKEKLADGNYNGAYDLFNKITDYKDVKQILATDYNMTDLEYTVGNTVNFAGEKWLVIERKDDKALILKEVHLGKIISYEWGPNIYNDENEAVTWETCSLRKYLNEDYYNRFSDQFRSRIIKTKIHTEDNKEYGTKGGKDTEDYIFLLSSEEVDSLLLNNRYKEWWWLRTPGRFQNYASVVSKPFGTSRADGATVYSGRFYDEDYGYFDLGEVYVRPAMWVEFY